MDTELTEYWIISKQFLNKFLEINNNLVEEAGKHVKFNYYKIRQHNLKKICVAHFMQNGRDQEMIRRVMEEGLPPKFIFQGSVGRSLSSGDFEENCEIIVGPIHFKKMHNLYLKMKQFIEQSETDRTVEEACEIYDKIYNPLPYSF